MQTSVPRWSGREADLLVTLVLLATALGIYGQTLGHPLISFDDPGYVVENAHVNRGLTWDGWRWAWTSLERSNWHPLTWLSLMVDAQLYGLRAGGYHLTNLLLHAINAVLIFRWLRTATGALWPAALTAFFFVAHPLHVESVAWVTERKDVLSTLFFCLTLVAYTRYARGDNPRAYWLSVVWYTLGLAAKPMLVTLPPLLLLLDYWPLRRLDAASWRRRLLEKIPFVGLAAASCVVTLAAQRATAMVSLVALPPAHRAASTALEYGTYLAKTLCPVGLGVYYPYWRAQSLGAPLVWAGVLLAVTLAAWLARRTLPFALVGWCWFLGTLVPVIGIVQVGEQAVADRYTYLPHVGLFFALFWTGAALWTRCGHAARLALASLTTGAALASVTLSYRQTGYWRTSAALFEHTVSVVRPTARLYHMLGYAELESGRFAEATDAYLQSWRLGYTSDDSIRFLGTLLLKARRWPEAAAVLAPARDRSTTSPDTLNNLAFALANSGRADDALAVYRQCVEHFPDFALAHFGLAEMLQARGDIIGAATQDVAGLALHADWLPALLRLGWGYAHDANPETRRIGLLLAKRAAELTDGQELGSLNVLAYAQAANGQWDAATATAARSLEAARRPGAPAGAEAGGRVRLEAYRQRQLPP